MRADLLISAILLSSLMMSCTKPTKSAAAAYKEKLSGGGSANVEPSEETGGGEEETGGGEEETGGGEEETGGGEETAAEGDVAEGNKLLATCGGCHPANGKTLNAAAVGDLEEAFTGAQKQTHGGFTEAFVDKRADLEAAMKAK